MIVFASTTFDAAYSPVEVQEDRSASDLRSISRRVTREATLDGGVAMSDLGFADGDRTIAVIVTDPSADIVSRLSSLAEASPLIRVSTVDGVFEGAIERLSYTRQVLTVRFLVKSKVSS